MSDLIERYLACWNETDPSARRALLAEHWSDAATYTDPLADVRGRDQIDATIAAVQQQFPGFVFTAVGAVDEHHRQARFGWGLGPVTGEPLVIGFDVVVLDDAGRFHTVLGFLDKIPAR
jgi:SnoaL-like domain